jgi:hypothetical protein
MNMSVHSGPVPFLSFTFLPFLVEIVHLHEKNMKSLWEVLEILGRRERRVSPVFLKPSTKPDASDATVLAALQNIQESIKKNVIAISAVNERAKARNSGLNEYEKQQLDQIALLNGRFQLNAGMALSITEEMSKDDSGRGDVEPQVVEKTNEEWEASSHSLSSTIWSTILALPPIVTIYEEWDAERKEREALAALTAYARLEAEGLSDSCSMSVPRDAFKGHVADVLHRWNDGF